MSYTDPAVAAQLPNIPDSDSRSSEHLARSRADSLVFPETSESSTGPFQGPGPSEPMHGNTLIRCVSEGDDPGVCEDSSEHEWEEHGPPLLDALCGHRNARENFDPHVATRWKTHRLEVLSEFHFKIGVAFSTFLVELLPQFISGPLVALRSGVVEARNRNLWPYNFLVDCFFFQTLWYTTVILVYIYSDVLPAWFVYETLSFTLFPIGRAAIVSTKYAFYGDIQLGDDENSSASLRSGTYHSSGQRLKNQMSCFTCNVDGNQMGQLIKILYKSCLFLDTDLSSVFFTFPLAAPEPPPPPTPLPVMKRQNSAGAMNLVWGAGERVLGGLRRSGSEPVLATQAEDLESGGGAALRREIQEGRINGSNSGRKNGSNSSQKNGSNVEPAELEPASGQQAALLGTDRPASGRSELGGPDAECVALEIWEGVVESLTDMYVTEGNQHSPDAWDSSNAKMPGAESAGPKMGRTFTIVGRERLPVSKQLLRAFTSKSTKKTKSPMEKALRKAARAGPLDRGSNARKSSKTKVSSEEEYVEDGLLLAAFFRERNAAIRGRAQENTLPATVLALHLVFKSFLWAPVKPAKNVYLTLLLLCFLIAFAPAIVRACQGKPVFGESGPEIAVSVLSQYSNSTALWLMLSYTVTPVFWTHSTLKLARELYRMLTGEGANGSGVTWQGRYSEDRKTQSMQVPRLDLRIPSNVHAWGTLRSALHGAAFGPVIARKFQIYEIVALSVFLSSAAIYVLGAYHLEATGQASIPVEVKIATVMRLSVLSIPVVVQVLLASSVNKVTNQMNESVCKASRGNLALASARNIRGHPGDALEAERLTEAAGLLAALSTELSVSETSAPMRVLFFKADPAVVSVLVSVVTSILVLLISDLSVFQTFMPKV